MTIGERDAEVTPGKSANPVTDYTFPVLVYMFEFRASDLSYPAFQLSCNNHGPTRVYLYLYYIIVTCIHIARQRVRKHIPAEKTRGKIGLHC
jgi:hypothetical protein